MALLVHPRGRGSSHRFRAVSAAERFSPPYLKNKAGKVFAPFMISRQASRRYSRLLASAMYAA
jgi:hypothetical protein